MQRWLTSKRYHSASYIPMKDCEGGCLPSYYSRPRLSYFAGITLVLGVTTLLINIYQLHAIQQGAASLHRALPVVESEEAKKFISNKPVVWIYGKDQDSGYLNHVYKVFDRIGYQFGNQDSEWNVLWSHDYPFKELGSTLKTLKPKQMVNHFPGSGFITNKVSLATSNIMFVPKAFRMPEDKDSFLNYVKFNGDKQFVQKNNKHRGIKVDKLSSLNLTAEGSFIQEFIQNPFLVDGKKFDIGIYTILTSVDPLRVYIYSGDALLRFCTHDYYPFDSEDENKYVVGDDYLPTWEVPSLKKSYTNLGFNMKESLNHYIRSKGKDPSKIWNSIEAAIREVFLNKEDKIINAVRNRYKSLRNFFEMVRFDFVVDEDLNLYIMEANMSPNLSSAHFPQNRLIYEQVIFNLLSVVGLASSIDSTSVEAGLEDTNAMQVSNKDITVNPEVCNSEDCSNENCNLEKCKLCLPCLSSEWIEILKSAHKEHMGKGNCKRVIPPQMTMSSGNTMELNLSQNNRLMHMWFKGKCIQNPMWCS